MIFGPVELLNFYVQLVVYEANSRNLELYSAVLDAAYIFAFLSIAMPSLAMLHTVTYRSFFLLSILFIFSFYYEPKYPC